MNILRPNLLKRTLLVLWLVLLIFTTNAQNPGSGLIFGINGGISKMMSEGNSLFSDRIKEFDQNAGSAFDLELSKLLFNHFELGTSVGISNIEGTLDNPIQSNDKYRIQGDYFIRDLQGPLEYSNRLISQKFFVGYYFRSFNNISQTLSPEPFLRAGLGYISYGVELFANDESTSGKGTDNYADLSMSSTLIFTTVGVKSYISPNFFVNVTYSLNYTNYDYLDAVFNFDSNEERLGYNGMYSEIKVGLFYQFAGKEKRGGGAKNGSGPNLPFSR